MCKVPAVKDAAGKVVKAAVEYYNTTTKVTVSAKDYNGLASVKEDQAPADDGAYQYWTAWLT
jgi:hypothetical protein